MFIKLTPIYIKGAYKLGGKNLYFLIHRYVDAQVEIAALNVSNYDQGPILTV